MMMIMKTMKMIWTSCVGANNQLLLPAFRFQQYYYYTIVVVTLVGAHVNTILVEFCVEFCGCFPEIQILFHNKHVNNFIGMLVIGIKMVTQWLIYKIRINYTPSITYI